MSGVTIDTEVFLADTRILPVGVRGLYALLVLHSLGEADPLVDEDGMVASRLGVTGQHWAALRRQLDGLITTTADGRLKTRHGQRSEG